MSAPSPKYFYTTDSWDEVAWVDATSIEYESLISDFPFNAELKMLSSDGWVDVLDVGCGSALFPQFLDPTLEDDLHLRCDLLDVSERSLDRAADVLGQLEHFSAEQRFKTLIEDIPSAFSSTAMKYDLIWAIHSFTTVDRSKMPAVLRRLTELLRSGGRMYIYQLTAQSSYQIFHRTYRDRVPTSAERFMEYEDTCRILDSLQVHYETLELRFDHELPVDEPEIVENYLRKCVLDETVDTERVFGDLLPRYRSDGSYRIPQSVNLISVEQP